MKLWQIGDDLERLALEVAEAGGEITPELEAKLDEIEGTLTSKVERVALKIRELEGHATMAKVEADRIGAIAKAHASAASGLKAYLLRQMERHRLDAVDTDRARVRLRRNSVPAIRWDGPSLMIPTEFQRVTIALNSAAVKLAIAENKPLPAEMRIEYGHHISIL